MALIGMTMLGWEALELFARLELGEIQVPSSWMGYSNFEQQLSAQLYCRVPRRRLEALTELVMRAAVRRLKPTDRWSEPLLEWIRSKQRLDQLQTFISTQPIAWRVSLRSTDNCLIGVYGPHYIGQSKENPYGPLNRGSSTDIMAY